MAESALPTSIKTVFVIGAGASHEARLPVGSDLKKSIAKALDIRFKHGYERISGDGAISDALYHAAKNWDPPQCDLNAFLHVCWQIRDAMPQAISIDNLLDAHRGDTMLELCGKLGIARTILQAENTSTLFVKPLEAERKIDFNSLETTWFNGFFQLLTENCRKSDLEQRLKTVVLIVFNYDRCIEHYLYHAIQNYYSISSSETISLLKLLEVYHPYGTVGSLPWSGQTNVIEFGSTPGTNQLLNLASQIKTFTEGTDESSSAVSAIRGHMQRSQRIVFLGFAFHRLNLDLLLPSSGSPKRDTNRQIFATALKLSDSDTRLITSELSKTAKIHEDNIKIRNNLTCYQLFQEYWRSLSLV